MAQRVPGLSRSNNSSRPTHWEYPGCGSSTRCAWQVGIKFSLCNYAFEVALADKMEQLFTHALFLYIP
jgi:hypothetical protein